MGNRKRAISIIRGFCLHASFQNLSSSNTKKAPVIDLETRNSKLEHLSHWYTSTLRSRYNETSPNCASTFAQRTTRTETKQMKEYIRYISTGRKKVVFRHAREDLHIFNKVINKVITDKHWQMKVFAT